MLIAGPVEGGTIITVTGTNLGVTFGDIQNGLILLGEAPCNPVNIISYITGNQFTCQTTEFINEGDKDFFIQIGSRNLASNGRPFLAVRPVIASISPVFGPMAGGTLVTVMGSHLDVGSQASTAVIISLGETILSCTVQ